MCTQRDPARRKSASRAARTQCLGRHGNMIMESGNLTAEQLLRHYTQKVYAQAGAVEEKARRLDPERRTVKTKLAQTT